jgi:hypothetical protein
MPLRITTNFEDVDDLFNAIVEMISKLPVDGTIILTDSISGNICEIHIFPSNYTINYNNSGDEPVNFGTIEGLFRSLFQKIREKHKLDFSVLPYEVPIDDLNIAIIANSKGQNASAQKIQTLFKGKKGGKSKRRRSNKRKSRRNKTY